MKLLASKGSNPIFALQCFFKGLTWLGKPQLRKFLLIPILINLSLYSVALGLGYFYLNDVINHLIPGWLHWLSWLLWPLFFVCVVVAGFFSFTILANLIASPFYGKLAAKTLELILQTTQQPDQESSEPAADTTEPSWQHTMLAELSRIAYLIKWILVLLVISLIPGLNLIAPLLWVLFGAWGCALEFFAYPLENKGLLFPAQKDLTTSVRLGALSFGGLVLLGLGVPFLNLLVAPTAVIAATLYIHGIDETANETATAKVELDK